MLHLGHQGLPCPSRITEDLTGHMSDTEPDSDCEEGDGDFHASLEHGLPQLKGPNANVIVDRSGVHRLLVISCGCDNRRQLDLQYMDMGLFPASFDTVKTAFTFNVLDDFRMDNVECKTSALNYYQKLARLTSNVFPKSIPVSRFSSKFDYD